MREEKMERRVGVRVCTEYDKEKIIALISEIYSSTGGPDPAGKRILLKPNILTDHEPERAISTHPVFVEAAILFFMQQGASEVMVGDSPSVHFSGFVPVKSGISDVCNRTGAKWVSFLRSPHEVKLRNGKIKVASAVLKADLVISLPKLKTHELMYLTCAIKNTLGIVPGFNKAAQHALHSDRRKFATFLVDLNEAVLPDYFLTDGIMAMEGPGPGNGLPVKMNVIIGSVNPLANDIIASKITGYNINDIATNKVALERGTWLTSAEDIIYNGPDPVTITNRNFRRVPIVKDGNIAIRFMIRRIRPLRRLEQRPVFNSTKCTGCSSCIEICPEKILSFHPKRENMVLINDSKCIRCFCCAEVCPSDAVEIKRKLF